MSNISSPANVSSPLNRGEVIKVTAASMIGTMFDFYDLFVASLASAVVWPTVFYPNFTPALALILSVTTFFVGYLVRPIGSLLFGHFGDKLGRLSALIWTLITTGIGTAGIAFTPSYASIGISGAYLIILFRIIQGIGGGGEWGGAATLVSEYAKDSKRRALWVSWVQQGNALGSVLSSAVWAYLFVAMPRPQFFDWGWRIPFYIGLIVLVIGLVIRLSVLESPVFKQYVMRKPTGKYPAAELIRTQWKKVLLLSFIPMSISGSSAWVTTVSTPFSAQLGVSAAVSANTIVWGSLIGIVAMAAFAVLADKIGRRWGIIISGLIPAAFAFPYMYMLKTGDLTLTIVANVVLIMFSRMGSGVFPAVLTEQYPTRFRYSGAGLTYAINSCWASVVSILGVASISIFGGPVLAWPIVGGILFIVFMSSVIAGFLIKETKKQDISY